MAPVEVRSRPSKGGSGRPSLPSAESYLLSTALTPDWKLRAVADVNGDASADAIVQHAPSGAILYANMAGGNFSGWGVVNQNLTVRLRRCVVRLLESERP